MEVDSPPNSATSTSTFVYVHSLTLDSPCPLCPPVWTWREFFKVFGLEDNLEERAIEFAIQHELIPEDLYCPLDASHGQLQLRTDPKQGRLGIFRCR